MIISLRRITSKFSSGLNVVTPHNSVVHSVLYKTLVLKAKSSGFDFFDGTCCIYVVCIANLWSELTDKDDEQSPDLE